MDVNDLASAISDCVTCLDDTNAKSLTVHGDNDLSVEISIVENRIAITASCSSSSKLIKGAK